MLFKKVTCSEKHILTNPYIQNAKLQTIEACGTYIYN
jgi:hypothetical protein